MHRREFVAGISTFFLANQVLSAMPLLQNPSGTTPQQPSAAANKPTEKDYNESDFPDYESYLKAQYPLPPLHLIIPIKVELDFFYGHFARWTTRQVAQMNRAALLFETVWSSQEFKDKVTGLTKPLYYRENAKITGAELYPKLVANPVITMPLTIVRNPRAIYIFGHENAASGEAETVIQKAYINKGSATVYELCNTISHEYTHYKAAGSSEDAGHSDKLNEYVSYGIGALTENLAAGRILDKDDPSLKADQSVGTSGAP
jgi:hypothetical protein